MKPIKNICLFTSTGAENLGDELITLCEIQEFLQVNPEIEITLFSHDIARTKRFLKSQNDSLNTITILEYFPNAWRKHPFKNISLFLQTLRVLKNTDHIFVGGGGLFYGKSDEGHSPMKLWWMRAFLAKILKKPFTYLSLGISIQAEDLKKSASMFFGNKTITVRDAESLKVVHDLGYNAELLPDPVSTYLPEGVDALSSKTIGIALRKGFMSDEIVLTVVKKLISQGYNILLLPHSLHPTDEKSHDGYYLQDFLIPGVEIAQSIEQTLAGYKRCHIIIGMRFHSMILAIDHHIPFVGISYGKKTDSLLSNIGWAQAFSGSTISADNIINAVGNIELNYNNLKMKLTDTHAQMEQEYTEKFIEILGE